MEPRHGTEHTSPTGRTAGTGPYPPAPTSAAVPPLPPVPAPTGHLPVAAPNAENPYVRTLDPHLAAYADEFLERVDELPTYRPTIGCVIPAYNEGETIAGVLDSLLMQTRLPGRDPRDRQQHHRRLRRGRRALRRAAHPHHADR